ncbi:hypothetical protein TREMEDRAFT_58438 [Tremella mesenterica DSM 1558]|uniref:uncharacterized protein n=1 Tax=Tremella mesenterica (strain ATCC 24925 / CBS 8224 / DSM 1558 / NBRC 9311 / NRRL Y-6157 / RJB 2259-6 / UBC 559-6) TaxID=578456 RepID=UPI0003F49F01|nr:uncharacterized protein TREMEDRAFT_58438 [Tremella mesenterica DSM 1558]EIW72278.1 hypothetical protein TREMEDRAFT_58438 [Tremella mesenterica DSM 1558]
MTNSDVSEFDLQSLLPRPVHRTYRHEWVDNPPSSRPCSALAKFITSNHTTDDDNLLRPMSAPPTLKLTPTSGWPEETATRCSSFPTSVYPETTAEGTQDGPNDVGLQLDAVAQSLLDMSSFYRWGPDWPGYVRVGLFRRCDLCTRLGQLFFQDHYTMGEDNDHREVYAITYRCNLHADPYTPLGHAALRGSGKSSMNQGDEV